MITVDYALRIYTDQLNSGNKVDMNYFRSNLNDEDYKEFQELIPFINLLKSTKVKQKFTEIFDRVDKYKESYYNNLPSAANFRSEKNSDFGKAKENLDKLFNEEFGND